MLSRRLPLWLGALLGGGICLAPAVAVAQRRAARVEVTPAEYQVQVGRTQPFVATAYDNAGNPIATATFVWTTSNARVATVDRQSGIATGVASGVATITATTGTGRNARSGEATLQVSGEGAVPQPQAAAPVRTPAPSAGARLTGPGCAAAEREPAGAGPAIGLQIEPLRVSLVKAESQQLSYRPVQGNGAPAEHLCVQFAMQAGGERVATVDSFGVVLAGNDTGHTVVQVTVPNRGFPARQIAVEVRGDSVRFRSHEFAMVPGAVDTLQLVVPAQGNRPVNALGVFQFVSSDTTKVRVAPLTPIITALAPGTARITAQSSIYPDIPVTINVHRRVTRLAGTPPDTLVLLAMGAQTSLSVRALAADTSPVTEVPMHWTIGDSAIVRYDTVTHVLRGLKIGETQIRVTVPVASDTVIFRNWHAKVIAGGLAISRPGARVALGVGERMPVEVKLLDDRRQPIETARGLTWTSSNDSVARVVDGQIAALSMGRARLTARAAWDSTVSADVSAVGELLVNALRAGRWDLYMLDRGVGGQLKVRQLTQDTIVKTLPAWSPTLLQIAYVGSVSGSFNSDLYVMDVDGGGIRQLTRDSASVKSPSFVGPAGDQIVFESSRGGKAQLYVIRTDGTGKRQLTSGDFPNTQPSVSPDGRQVLFASVRDRTYGIYVMGMDGTGERRLAASPRQEDSPDWAADGHSVYYLRDDGGKPLSKRVYRQDLETGAATPVTPVGMFVQDYSVSVDGETLALLVLSADANGVQSARVSLLNATTGVMTPVTIQGADRVAGPALRPATPQH